MALTTNTTLNDSLIHEAPCFRQDTQIIRSFRVAPFIPIMFFALTGNPLVIAVVCKNKPMRKTINFFIASMGLSDFIFTAVYIPRVVTILIFGYKWLLSDFAGLILCKTVPFLTEVSIIVSVLTIVIISLDRFLAVNFPLRTFMTTKLCVLAICATWLLAICVRIPTMIATEFDKYQGDTYCLLDMDLAYGQGIGKLYFKTVFVALYGIPFTIIVLLNTAIVMAMYRRKMPGNSASTTFIRRQEQMNRKVLRMVLVVVATFLLCWSLYFVLMVLRKNHVHVPCNVLYLRLVLAHFNAALTPWLYAMLSWNYRRGFVDILSKLGCLVFVLPQEAPKGDRITSSRQNSALQDSRLRGIEMSEFDQFGSNTILFN